MSFLSRLGRKDVGILLVYNGRLTHATLSRKMSRQSDVDQPRSYLKWSWLLARKNERNLRKVKENDDFSHQFNCNYALFYLLLRIVTLWLMDGRRDWMGQIFHFIQLRKVKTQFITINLHFFLHTASHCLKVITFCLVYSRNPMINPTLDIQKKLSRRSYSYILYIFYTFFRDELFYYMNKKK